MGKTGSGWRSVMQYYGSTPCLVAIAEAAAEADTICGVGPVEYGTLHMLSEFGQHGGSDQAPGIFGEDAGWWTQSRPLLGVTHT